MAREGHGPAADPVALTPAVRPGRTDDPTSTRAPSAATASLVARLRAGDADAWQELIDKYEGRLTAFVRSRLRDRQHAEDVVQEALVGFLRSLVNFDETRSLENYLFTIAAHKIRDHLRHKQRRPEAAQADLDGSGDSDGSTVASEPAGRVRGPSSLLASAERVRGEEERLRDALAALVADWRAAGDHRRVMCIELLFVAGWPNRDVAARLGYSEQQVANYKFQVLERLARRVKRAGEAADKGGGKP